MSSKPVLDVTQVTEQEDVEQQQQEEFVRDEDEGDTSVSCTFKATSSAPDDVVKVLEQLPQVMSVARGQPDSEDRFTGAIRFIDADAMRAVSDALKSAEIASLKTCGLKLMWKGKHAHIPGVGKACPEKPIAPPPAAKRGVKVDNSLLSFRFSDETPVVEQNRTGTGRGGVIGHRPVGRGGGQGRGAPRRDGENNSTEGGRGGDGRGKRTHQLHPGYEAAWQSMYGAPPSAKAKQNAVAARGHGASFGGPLRQDNFSRGRGSRQTLIEAHVLCLQGVPFSTTYNEIVNRLKPDLAAAADASVACAGPVVYNIARSEDMALVYMATSEAVFAAVTTLNGSSFGGRLVTACSGGACKVPAPPGHEPPQRDSSSQVQSETEVLARTAVA